MPILLAYVYGVVPIALCRSGCGVSTTHTGGVRFEFDEDQEGHATLSGPFGGNWGESKDVFVIFKQFQPIHFWKE